MTTNPFSAPATPSDGIKWGDLNGRLLIIEPLADEKGIQTSFGEADAVRANVYAIDGTVEEHDDVLVFPKVLSGQLRPKIGERVIGRLSQGVAKPSQSPPWILADATPADIQTGINWLASKDTNQFTTVDSAQGDTGTPPF